MGVIDIILFALAILELAFEIAKGSYGRLSYLSGSIIPITAVMLGVIRLPRTLTGLLAILYRKNSRFINYYFLTRLITLGFTVIISIADVIVAV